MSYIYTYVDLNNIIQEVYGDTLGFLGNWSRTVDYFAGDVVFFNTNRYIALAASLNREPPITVIRDDKWSVLTLVSSGSSIPGDVAAQALDLANHAYNIAVYGTTVAEIAYSYAIYAIAVAGTAGAPDLSVPMALGRAALETAWVGTGIANQAYDFAVYAISVAGTAGGGTGDLSEPMKLGKAALETAWVGTNAGNQSYNVAVQAYQLAVTGTQSGTHNSLSGLQGGTSNEYYHLTFDQDAAAAGSFGSPSNTNRYVTQQDPILGNGAEARRLASGAYDLAVTGTNTANAAQADATNALNQLSTISTLVLVGQQGTFNLCMAQVPNWKSDIPVVVVNGVFTYIDSSRYQYTDFRNWKIGLAGTSLGDLSIGFTWGGSNVIQSGYNSYDTGLQLNDPIYRQIQDEFNAQGTLGQHNMFLNRGSGWAEPWNAGESYALDGTESFEDYADGAILGVNMLSGYGFTGTTSFN